MGSLNLSLYPLNPVGGHKLKASSSTLVTITRVTALGSGVRLLCCLLGLSVCQLSRSLHPGLRLSICKVGGLRDPQVRSLCRSALCPDSQAMPGGGKGHFFKANI